MYIREAHASDSDWPLRGRGPKVNDPKSLTERISVAKSCAKAVKFSMPMLIDGIDDTVASDYGGHPDRLYLVGRDGYIAYKGGPGPHGFRPDDLESELKKLLAAGGSRRARRF